jgi:hypothetical protein
MVKNLIWNISSFQIIIKKITTTFRPVIFSNVCVALSLVFWIVFCRSLFVFCLFVINHYCLSFDLLSIYHFGIFKLLTVSVASLVANPVTSRILGNDRIVITTNEHISGHLLHRYWRFQLNHYQVHCDMNQQLNCLPHPRPVSYPLCHRYG